MCGCVLGGEMRLSRCGCVDVFLCLCVLVLCYALAVATSGCSLFWVCESVFICKLT